MKLPSQKRILREDLKDAPDWVSPLIDTLNSFMDTVYIALNKNVTFQENIAAFTKELIYNTPSTYPSGVDNVEFVTQLKTKATGVWVIQAVDRSTYIPATGPVYAPWVEDNGTIVISPILGLAADKSYLVRLVVI